MFWNNLTKLKSCPCPDKSSKKLCNSDNSPLNEKMSLVNSITSFDIAFIFDKNS